MKLQDPRVASLKTLQKDCVERFEFLEMLELLEVLFIEVLVMLDDQGA